MSVWLNGLSLWAPGTQPTGHSQKTRQNVSQKCPTLGERKEGRYLSSSLSTELCVFPHFSALWPSTEGHRWRGTGVVWECEVYARIMRAQKFGPVLFQLPWKISREGCCQQICRKASFSPYQFVVLPSPVASLGHCSNGNRLFPEWGSEQLPLQVWWPSLLTSMWDILTCTMTSILLWAMKGKTFYFHLSVFINRFFQCQGLNASPYKCKLCTTVPHPQIL